MFKDVLEKTGKGWVSSPKFSKFFSGYKRLRKTAACQYAMITDSVGTVGDRYDSITLIYGVISPRYLRI